MQQSIRSADTPTRYKAIGTILMLPIGAIVAFVIVFLLALRGSYYLGEFLLVFVLLFGVMFVVRTLFWRSRRRYMREHWQGDESVRILRERYAKGEITREEFHQMLRDLRQSPINPEGSKEQS
jgi:uncharacterized membrane protein